MRATSWLLSVVGPLCLCTLATQASAYWFGPNTQAASDRKRESAVKAVEPFRGEYPEVYRHIDMKREEHVQELQKWVRQPSISAQGDGVAQMADLLGKDLKDIGFHEVEVVPTKGHPGVWGYYNAGAKTTIAVYMMYDVQPVETTGWTAAPFDGSIVDLPMGRAIVARGITNQKGPQRAFLNAIKSMLAVEGTLPVNLMILAEGEEEVGSVHYPDLIRKYADRLKTATGVIFPTNSQSDSGGVQLVLGQKGLLYFEMIARAGDIGTPRAAEVHSSLKVLLSSPVWRLTQALASLTSPDGNTILVPGYGDSIVKASAEEERLIDDMEQSWSAREAGMKAAFGVKSWIGNVTGRESLAASLSGTTLNIDGIYSGYSGPGIKTILPAVATAKLDSRLVPNQTPEEALSLIREHLDAKGFQDIEIVKLAG